MFFITGTLQGRTASLKFEDRIISGDKAAMDKARYENTQDHGGLGIPPSYVERDYLSCELAARHLIRKYVFDTVISEENDDPPYNPKAAY